MPVVPTLDVESYLDFKSMTRYLKAVAQAAPHLVNVASIGKSREGRPLVVAEVTNGDGREKPGIWIDGGHQGWNLLGSTACLELLRFLVAGHGRDELLTELVDKTVFYIAPRLAPDEMEQCLAGGALVTQQLESPGQPIQGRQFRLANPLGSWKPFKRDHRVMALRNPEDREEPFYDLYRSLDSGRMARVGPHDFPSPSNPYIASQLPSTKAVIEFMRKYRNVFGVISCSGPGDRLSLVSDTDHNTLSQLESRLGELAGLAVTPKCSTTQREGQFLAWAARSLGVLAADCQLWSLRAAAGLKTDELEDPFKADETEILQLMRFCEKEFPEGSFSDWTEHSDPLLGKGEIGGWDWSRTWLNPPAGPYLARELKKLTRLALGLASASPRLVVPRPEETVVGWSEDKQPLRKLILRVENSGFLPTCPIENGRSMDGSVDLNLGSNALLMGEPRTRLSELRGTGGYLCEDGLPREDDGELPGQRSETYQFLIKGSQPVEIVVSHPLAGTQVATSRPPQSLAAPSFETDKPAAPSASFADAEDDPFEDAFPSFEDLYEDQPSLPPTPPLQPPPPVLAERPSREHEPVVAPEPIRGSGEFNIPDPSPDQAQKARPVTFGPLDDAPQERGPFPAQKPSKGRVFGSPPQKPGTALPAALTGAAPAASKPEQATPEGEFSPLPLIKSKDEQGGGAFEPLTPGRKPAPEKKGFLGETIGGDVPAPGRGESAPVQHSAPPARLTRAPKLLRRQSGGQAPGEPFKRP
ncbi:MAG: M14 family zinc carboxypeptidase [Vulcanimicrobiota bacterium]